MSEDSKFSAMVTDVTSSAAKSRGFIAISELLGENVPHGRMMANFTPSGRAGTNLLMRLSQNGDVEADETRITPFPVVKWLACRDKYQRDNEEVARDAVTLMLIGPEGKTLKVTSPYVVRDFDRFRGIEGDGPYEPPVLIRIVETKTGGGRKMNNLQILDIDPPATPSPEAKSPKK